MKHKILAIITLAIACTACNDFLTDDPTGGKEVNEIATNETQLYQNFVAALYNHVGGNTDNEGLQGTGRGVYDMNTFTTDEAIMPTRGGDWYDGGYWQNLYTHDWNGTDGIGDVWKYLFKCVNLCNLSLEQIAAFETQNAASANTAAWRAEVRALRAMWLFYAMDLYGRVPIYSSSSPSVAEMALQSRSTAYRHIVAELQEALPLLPLQRSNHSGQYYGRLTRPVAWFLLAKLALNAQVYAHDDWTNAATQPSGSDVTFAIDGAAMNAWQACQHYCSLIAAAGYSLEANQSACFAVNNEGSTENIFTIPMDKNLYGNIMVNLFRSRHYNHASALGLNGENGSSATIEAMQAFGYGTANEDPRLATTYYTGTVTGRDGSVVTLDDGTPLVYHPMQVRLDLTGSPYEQTAGARMAKYEIDYTGTKDGKQSDNDIVLFRYADVLLMQAEAAVRNGGSGDQWLNQVRSRAGVEPIAGASLQDILDERLRELAWEGWRRNDLVRYGQFTRAWSNRPQIDEDVQRYTLVFPIPGDYLSIAQSAQNPGY